MSKNASVLVCLGSWFAALAVAGGIAYTEIGPTGPMVALLVWLAFVSGFQHGDAVGAAYEREKKDSAKNSA